MRLSVFFLAFALGGCLDAPPQIVGPYASRLSPADAEEIRVLAVKSCADSSIHAARGPIKFSVYRPTYVGVEVPLADPRGDTLSFTVEKRHGHWVESGGVVERVIVW